MPLREHVSIHLHGMAKQLQIGNKISVTWVPGVRAAKVRYGRAWAKVLLGRQSIKLFWGLSPAHVDRPDDG